MDIPHDNLRRILRFLIHHGIFKKTGDDHYSENALSRGKMAAFLLLHGTPPPTLSGVTAEVLRTGKRPDVKPDDREDTWSYPTYGNHMKVFTDSMDAHSRVTTSAIVSNYPYLFSGIASAAPSAPSPPSAASPSTSFRSSPRLRPAPASSSSAAACSGRFPKPTPSSSCASSTTGATVAMSKY